MTLTMQRPLLKLELGLTVIFLMASIAWYFGICQFLPLPEASPYYGHPDMHWAVMGLHFWTRFLPILLIGTGCYAKYLWIQHERQMQKESDEHIRRVEERGKSRRGEI